MVKKLIAMVAVLHACTPLLLAETSPPPGATLTVSGKMVASGKVNDRGLGAKAGGKQEGTSKTLEIRITSTSSVDPGLLTVKCSFLGRDIATKQKVVYKETSLETRLSGREIVVRSEPVVFETSGGGVIKGPDGKPVKVAQSGVDYRGYQILVSNEAGDVIGKAYSSPAIQEDVEKGEKK